MTEKDRKTQAERLLEFLRKHGSINPLEAWNRLGIYRLAARCEELRKAGHKIESARVTVRNRFGEKCRVAEYRMTQAGGTA